MAPKKLTPLMFPNVLPIVPPVSAWKQDSVLQDQFWDRAKNHLESPTPVFTKKVPYKEPREDSVQNSIIPGESVLRFRVERGDLPTSHIEFAAAGGPSHGWKKWFEYAVLSAPNAEDFKKNLRDAGVLEAIEISTRMDVTRDFNGLALLISRWSSATNTFVAAWGEFSPTLLDVVTLLRLDVLGTESPLNLALDQDEAEIMAELNDAKSKCKFPASLKAKTARKKGQSASTSEASEETEAEEEAPAAGSGKSDSHRGNFLGWIRYWFKEFEGDNSLEGPRYNHKYSHYLDDSKWAALNKAA